MKKILVIEDELFLRKNIKELLQNHGYEVSDAGTKTEAMQYILQKKPFRTAELLSRIEANLRRVTMEQQKNVIQCGEIVLDVTQERVLKSSYAS